MKKLKIMFVCTGNICRSPAAHAVLEHMLKEEGLDGRVEVESSGTDSYHSGEQADPRMRATCQAHGVKIDHRSRKFKARDLDNYDMIAVMDSGHYEEIKSLCRSDKQMEKVFLFRRFDPQGGGNVPDPWYGGQEGFENVWHIINRTSEYLLKDIKRRLD